MKASESNIVEFMDFKGIWDLPSKCGLRLINKGDQQVVIVTELYQHNPGSSITTVSASLAMQIVEKYHLDTAKLVYVESSPDMHSKLSFYDEEYYLVNFDLIDGILGNPKWKKLKISDFKNLVE